MAIFDVLTTGAAALLLTALWALFIGAVWRATGGAAAGMPWTAQSSSSPQIACTTRSNS